MLAFFLSIVIFTRELFRIPAVFLFAAPSRSTGARVGAISDELLVQRFQEGDQVAFELLVRRYQNVAFTVCRRYLVNPEAAEETAQDVFVSLFRKLGDFRGESSFKSWFYRVLVNHCRNRHKAGVRRKQHLHDSLDAPRDDEDDGRRMELPDGGYDPEQALAERRQQQLMERALESLPEDVRMVLLLREGQGLAYEDIASSLGIATGTVKSRIHRARADLKTAVNRLSRQCC